MLKRIYIVTVFLLSFLINTYAQIGISLSYGFHDFKSWNELTVITKNNEKVFSQGPKVGIDYSFKPISQRMEMTIETSFGIYETDLSPQLDFIANTNLNEINLDIKNNFYIFSFNNCNTCPDFNKKGEKFEKGFFLQTILGGNLQLFDFSGRIFTGLYSYTNIAYHIGAGIGYDIHIADRWMITPYANYIFGFHNKYADISLLTDLDIAKTTNRTSINFGLRIGLKKKK